MAITKQKKAEVLKNLEGIIKDSGSLVFANFHGLNVLDVSAMRKDLKSKGVGYYVAKKNLIKKAIADSKLPGQMPELEGELAIAYSEDLLDSARGIYEFQQKYAKKVSILGGVFEGEIVGQEKMLEIALIPPMQTLRGMFVNLINSPIQRVVIAMNEIASTKTSA